MAEKLSKTARRSTGDTKKQLGKRCPGCGDYMVATKVIKSATTPGGMFWICQSCSHRERIHK